MTIATLLNLPGNEKFKADPDKIKPGEKLNIDAAKAKLDTQILPDPMKEINEMQKNLDDSKHFELERREAKLPVGTFIPNLNCSSNLNAAEREIQELEIKQQNDKMNDTGGMCIANNLLNTPSTVGGICTPIDNNLLNPAPAGNLTTNLGNEVTRDFNNNITGGTTFA